MGQYIDKSVLVAELKNRIRDYWSDTENTMGIYPYALEEVIKYVDTLEVKEGKQIIIITESDGDAHIHWDCRSLEDVNILLDCAKSFIIDRQTEGVRGRGSFPYYNTEEGRYKDLFAKMDLEKEYDNEFFKDPVFGKLVNRNAGISIAKHFFELGLKAQKGE